MYSRERHQELCDKIEALLREYSDAIPIHDPRCDEHPPEERSDSDPDWHHPLALQHWALIFTIDDSNPDPFRRGYWTLSVEPPTQRPYITLGLLEEAIARIL